MQMMINYACFNTEQYGKKEKKSKLELVKMIAQNVKVCKDPIADETQPNTDSEDELNVSQFEV